MKKNSTEWISIGTVLGDTNIDTFFFNLKNHKAKKGDIVTTESKVPTGEGKVVPVTVWGRSLRSFWNESVRNYPFLNGERTKPR